MGYELIGAGMLILAGGSRGLPMDYDELERWTRVGFERGMASRRGGAVMPPCSRLTNGEPRRGPGRSAGARSTRATALADSREPDPLPEALQGVRCGMYQRAWSAVLPSATFDRSDGKERDHAEVTTRSGRPARSRAGPPGTSSHGLRRRSIGAEHRQAGGTWRRRRWRRRRGMVREV